MMEVNITLTTADAERLYAVKELQGKGNMTVNDFARELLTMELRRLFPAVPKYDEDTGELLNADRFREDKV